MSAPTAEVPSSIDDLTPQWLSVVLGAPVQDVRAERIAEDTGFSSLLYRLHLTSTRDLPATLIAKLPAQSEARGAMEMMGGYRREVLFYRDIAPGAPLDTPSVYAARLNDAGDFVLLLEDLQEWENADHLAGLSLDRARLCIAQLAGLHAWSTGPVNNAALRQFPSIDSRVARDLLVPAFAPGWQVYRDKADAPVPARVARFAERFAESAPTALRALGERSMLLHGDIRADNMFFAGDRLKVVDFQMSTLGAGPADIAYLISQGLPTEVRRGCDEDLVREYLEHLAVPGYTFDEAWRHYRFATAYLMVLPVITLIGWEAMPERSRRLCLKLTDRAVATVEDIDALEVFT